MFPEPGKGGARALELTCELDGPVLGFGRRFWEAVSPIDATNGLPSDKTIVELTYEDRYLATPLSCALLVEVISALKQRYEGLDRWDDPKVQVTTMEVDESKPRRSRDQWFSDWSSHSVRDEALVAALEYCGLRARVNSKDKRDLIHGRRLCVQFSDGSECTVWLDQGLSFWSLSREPGRHVSAAFPCASSSSVLGERLAECRVDVSGHVLPTQVFVTEGGH